MKPTLFACVLLLGSVAGAQTQDVLGAHDLYSSRVKGAMSSACLYCHVPHSGTGAGALWGQTLSTQTYSLYSSDTSRNTTVQPPLGAASTLCLSCHDGTVAPGQITPNGPIQMSGTMASVLGTRLENSHPFSLTLPLKDSANLVPSLAASQTTADPTKSVKLIQGNIECTSCHDAHNQRIDKNATKFLVRENRFGGLCLSCHETTPRTVNSQTNKLAQWTTGAHATTAAQVSITSGLGGYSTVGEFACLSCHMPHNAGAAAGLLRNPAPPVPNIDSTSQSCITCHDGGDKLLQPLPNVFAEFAKTGHPFANASNVHDGAEPAVLANNRHAACADCHNPHSSVAVTSFGVAPGIRVSQGGAVGVSAVDGSSVVNPAVNQYETCLRCHGTSPGKQTLSTYGYAPVRAVNAADPLNLIPQFAPTSSSSHPVMHPPSSGFPQPSLRRNMLNLDGVTNSARLLDSGSSIFCSDCHNSDVNREFGGTGPNGPHGSLNTHILERRYEFSQVAAGASSGTRIQNLLPNPNLNAGGPSPGPYALCGKCHDLANILTNASFQRHSLHVSELGFSCSVCHTAHGMGSVSASISGQRLVNFDVNVVAPNGTRPISYNRATNTCTLICHGQAH